MTVLKTKKTTILSSSPNAEYVSEERAKSLASAGVLAEEVLFDSNEAVQQDIAKLEKTIEANIRVNGERAYRASLAQERWNKSVDASLEEAIVMAIEEDQMTEAVVLIQESQAINPDDFIATLEDSMVSNLGTQAEMEEPLATSILEQGYHRSDIIRDQESKSAMTAHAIDRLSVLMDEAGIRDNVGEFLVRLIPYVDTYLSNKAVGKSVEGLSGFTNIKEMLELAEGMTPLEWGKWLNSFLSEMEGSNKGYAIDFLRVVAKDQKSAATVAGAIELIDAVPFLGTAVKFGKGAFKSVKTLSALGGKQGATTRAIKELVNETTEEASEQAIDIVLPSTFTSTEDLVVGVSGDVTTNLQVNNEIINQILSIARPERLEQGVLDKLVKEAKETATRKFEGKATPADSGLTVDQESGIRTIHTRFGKPDGGGFPLEEDALRYGGMVLGLRKGAYTSFQDTSGMWYTSVPSTVRETVNLGKGVNAYKASDKSPISAFKRYVGSAKETQEEVSKLAQQLGEVSAAKMQSLMSDLVKINIKPLKKKALKDLDVVAQKSHDTETWFKVGELKAYYRERLRREATDADVSAYYTLKQLDDLDYHIRNTHVRTELDRRGYKKINIKAFNWPRKFVFNAVPHKVIQDKFIGRTFFDAEAGGRPFEMSRELLQEKLDEGYVVLQPNKALRSGDIIDEAEGVINKPVEFVLVKGKNVSESTLDAFQLGYLAGGHRVYDASFFIKQARRGGGGYLKPLVHNAGDNFREMKVHVENLEKIRLIYISKELGDGAKDSAIKRIMPDSSLKHWEDMELSGSIEVDEPFQLMRDKQQPRGSLAEDQAQAYKHDDMPNYIDYVDTSGKMYYGQRGARLREIDGKVAPVIDPIGAAGEALANSLHLRAFSNYETKAIERWVNAYGKHLDDKGAEFASDKSRFLHSDVLPGPHFHRAEAQREQIRSFLGQKTKGAELWDEQLYHLGEWLSERGKDRVSKWALDYRSKDPIVAMRGLAFDARLGMFGLDQLLLQTQTAWAAMTIDPVNGVEALKNGWLLRGAMLNGTPEVTRNFAKKVAKLSGTKVEDFETMVDLITRSGVTDIGGNLAILDNFRVARSLNRANNNIVENVRDKGRMFFYEGERFNKVVAFNIAFKRWQKANPGASPYLRGTKDIDPRVMEKLVDETNTFSINMTRASAAWWQRGVASIPTQFLSYQARFLELMLPQMMGGSASFTSAEKFRMAVGQVLFYGAAGVPPIVGAQQLYENAVGKVAPEGIAEDFLKQGMWDTLLLPWIFGDNTDFADRAAIFGNTSLVSDIWDPDSPFWEIAAGPSFQVGSDIVDVFLESLEIASIRNTDQILPITIDVLVAAMQVPSTGSRIMRARRMYMTEFYVNSRGVRVLKVDKEDAFAAAGGIPLKSVTDHYESENSLFDVQKHRQEVTGELRQHQVDLIAAIHAGDTKKAKWLGHVMRVKAQIEFPNDEDSRRIVLRNSMKGLETQASRSLQERLKHKELRDKAIEEIQEKASE